MILDALRQLDFETLCEGKEQTPFVFLGREASYHWHVHHASIAGTEGIVLEFDVHPSRFPVTISDSEFIAIRDQVHLEEIKAHLKQSDDYTRWRVSPSARWVPPHTG